MNGKLVITAPADICRFVYYRGQYYSEFTLHVWEIDGVAYHALLTLKEQLANYVKTEEAASRS